MGFMDSLIGILGEIGEMNNQAMRDVVNLSTEDLCDKLNSTNAIVNPLIWANCSEELGRRAKQMSNSVLCSYYEAYLDYPVKDAANVFEEELKKRGYDV